MTLLVLIRHADTDWVGRGFAGWQPGVHLNARGRQQARELAAALDGFELRALYSSPLERALQTAQSIADRLMLPVQLCAGLGELELGEWTGRTFASLQASPEFTRFNSFRSGTRVPGGETMLETQGRAVSALLALREQHPHECIAAVSHADVLRAVLAHFLGMPLDLSHRLQLDPASFSLVRLEPDSVQVLGLNATRSR